MPKLIDPENRYLIAFDQLGARAKAIYEEYGDLMEACPANRGKLAKKLGASVNTVGQVISFVEVWGGPTNGGLPSILAEQANERQPNAHYIIPDAHFSRKDRINGYMRAARLGVHMALSYIRCSRRGQVLRFVCLGDWWDMVSLCFYEKDSASFALQSVAEDIETGEVAMAVLMDAFHKALTTRGVEFDASMATFDFTLGNHEIRVNKALKHAQHGPLLKGVRSFSDILAEHGWRTHEYMKPANIDGVAYAHCLPSGVMGRAIGGVNAAKSLVDKMLVSCVVGHSHVLDLNVQTDAFGGKKFGLVAGCYYDRVPDYAASTGHLWWRGVILLNGVKDGALLRGHAAVTVEDMIDTVGF